jgi:hypothetical protein
VRHTSLTEDDIGLIKGDVFDVEDKTIIITTPQTLASKFKNEKDVIYPKIRDIGIGLVVWDECLSSDTEILTEDGWVLISKLDKETNVAQFDTESKEISFVKPTRYIKNRYTGKLVNLKNRNIDLLTTLDHEQPVYNKSTNVCRKLKMDDVKLNHITTIPTHGTLIKTNAEQFNDFHRFLIALQADGSIQRENLTKKRYQVSFTLCKQRKIDRLLDIVKKLGYECNEVKCQQSKAKLKRRRFLIYPENVNIYKNFEDWFKISDHDSVFCDEFIKELVEWDGSTKGGRLYYSSTVSSNIDIIQQIAVCAGYKCTRGVQVDNRKTTYKDVHRIWLYKDVEVLTQSIKKTYVDYDDYVYCVEVPDHNIVVRRNGKVSITGNCHKIADKWASGAFLINTPHFIGLTATPYHTQDKDILMKSIFGEIETSYGEYDFSPEIKYIEFESTISPKYGWVISKQWEQNFNAGRAMYNKGMTSCTNWQKLCGDIMEQELKDDNNRMLVLVQTKKQIEILCKIATERGLEPVKLFSEQTEIDKENDRLIIATLKYATEAFDYAQLNRLLLAVPLLGRKSLIQAIGRILRSCEGKNSAIVFDLIDIGKSIKGIFSDAIERKLKILKEEYEDLRYSIRKLN